MIFILLPSFVFFGSFLYSAVLCSQEIPEFDYSGCPARNDSTVSIVKTKITVNASMKVWQPFSLFVFKRKDAIIYIYNPIASTVEKNDVRFKILRDRRNNDFTIVSTFQYDDSGADFQYGFQNNWNADYIYFCSVLINEDLTPIAVLERHAPPELGYRDRTYYMEGERIIVACSVQKIFNETFEVNFPKGTKYILDESNKKLKSFAITLTKNIKGGNISCILSKGVSTWNDRFLRFVDKPEEVTDPSRTNLAISIAVFSCLMLIFMLIFGSYTLIIKQRKDQTKAMVKHHTETAKVRMNSRISQMRRMSQIPRGNSDDYYDD